MRTSSVKNLFQSIEKKFSNAKAIRNQKMLDKYVDISNVSPYSAKNPVSVEAYNQILASQSGLANYAKANNVRIKIGSLGGEAYPNSIYLSVSSKGKNPSTKVASINADTNVIQTIERDVPRVLENKDGLNYKFVGTETQEDNFQRRMYRTTSILTNDVKERSL